MATSIHTTAKESLASVVAEYCGIVAESITPPPSSNLDAIRFGEIVTAMAGTAKRALKEIMWETPYPDLVHARLSGRDLASVPHRPTSPQVVVVHDFVRRSIADFVTNSNTLVLFNGSRKEQQAYTDQLANLAFELIAERNRQTTYTMQQVGKTMTEVGGGGKTANPMRCACLEDRIKRRIKSLKPRRQVSLDRLRGGGQ